MAEGAEFTRRVWKVVLWQSGVVVNVVEVAAEHARLVNRDLVFLDEGMDILRAFAAKTWMSCEEALE